MKIQVNGKKIDVGDSLRLYVEEKTSELILKYTRSVTDISTTFSKERYEYSCDISLHLSTGITAQAKGKANDIYESFENSLEKISKQLRRYKRRLKNHHKDRKKPVEFTKANTYVISTHDEGADFNEKESLKPLIIAEMRTEIPTLSVGEAVMQMELKGTNILIFINSLNKKVNVIHLRDDGNIGWVDPEHSK